MNNFLEIVKKIKSSKNILLTAHKNPDGDAVGSTLAFYLAIKKIISKDKLDINVRIILQDKIPNTTKFLKFSEEFEIFNENNFSDFDLVIFLDSANRDRVGIINDFTKNIYTINIDHHISNDNFGDMNYVLPKLSSTSEIVYNIFSELNIEIDLNMSYALYLGLVNDTGNFAFDNVTKDTLLMAADLISKGVDNSLVVRNFLDAHSFAALKILGEALKNFEFIQDKKLSYYFLTKETMKKYSAKKEDCEGLVNQLLSLDLASVSLFLREDDNGEIKGSMRSKYEIDVNKIANIFDGGGHRKASGFSSNKSANEILNIVLENL